MKRSSPVFASKVLPRILIAPRLCGSTPPRVLHPPDPGSTGTILTARRLALVQGCVGAQPQRDVRRLHRPPNHPDEILVQGIEVRLVPEFGREGFQGPG